MSILEHAMAVSERFLAPGPGNIGHTEKWLSASGGLFGILAVSLVSQQFLAVEQAALLVASMGASAVLLFAVPHGPLSQPWPVLAGHTVSALVGVACARWLADTLFAAAAAVALAIAAMYYLRCIHPPGGATALTAVIGGSEIHALGFHYVLTPVLLNALSIVVMAIVFNFAFRWRRYPAMLSVPRSKPEAAVRPPHEIPDHNDLVTAMQAVNGAARMSGRELAEILRFTLRERSAHSPASITLRAGRSYSNGRYGKDWQVRMITDMDAPATLSAGRLSYRIVAGANRRKTGISDIGTFSRWARYEVFLNENTWQRKQRGDILYDKQQAAGSQSHG